MQVGFLEVIGNAIVEYYRKKIDDSMHLAFSQLKKILYKKGVADEELKQKLGPFRIIVDKAFCYLRYGIFNGAYLARVEHLYNQIIELLSTMSQQNMCPQQITVPVVASLAILKTHRSIMLDDF
ncbi:21872_t:CDS:2 [Gigaspora margarita]|uniref:21872_t:CDS:1 n=1 Tax=Gigaspora margarita TaxID=4874 RepID=A0ABN7VFD6_GIGMA|nr:21872_t:CDS:2 [Gigaspora margarita]